MTVISSSVKVAGPGPLPQMHLNGKCLLVLGLVYLPYSEVFPPKGHATAGTRDINIWKANETILSMALGIFEAFQNIIETSKSSFMHLPSSDVGHATLCRRLHLTKPCLLS